MNLFFDTSALIKKYVIENGSDEVLELMNRADQIFVSVITEIEAHSAFKRLLSEKAVNEYDYKTLINEFDADYQYFTRINIDDFVLKNAKLLIERHQLKTLDSIQMGTALLLKDDIDCLVSCDARMIRSGKKEGLKTADPSA